MKVLFLSAEATPYVKVGGLGDVAGALPQALRKLGMDVRLMVPRYGSIDHQEYGLTKILDNYPVPMDWRREECLLFKSADGQAFFIENQYFHGSRSNVYGEADDAERFVLFARAALEACRYLDWWPDIIHAHDWHSGAACRIAWAAPEKPGLVYTIHNIAHQGRCSARKWPLVGVYDGRGILNLMEQAIWAADMVTTVSPTYAREILTSDYGFGMESILSLKGDRLVGILNGLDSDSWNPAADSTLAANYSSQNLAGKARCKAALQRQVGLPVRPKVPLIGVVSRLDDQKGIRLIVDSLGDILALTQCQIMVLGSGHEPYEQAFQRATHYHPDRVANYIGFNGELARQIYAGADIFLMPSNFEPCGLSQMIAMCYGTLPVVRATGGLADSVWDMNESEGTGFVFGPYYKGAMLEALGRAYRFYWNRQAWKAAMARAMEQDFSWNRSAVRYQDVYKRSLAIRS